jgi:nucleotide-binding universal stress UspA family protein
MQRIMVATDFSERSDRALRRAVLLARAHGAILDVVHVVDDDRSPRIVEHETADARDLLHELSQTLQSVDGIRSETAVLLADPFEGIVKATRDRFPDLLVIGPHRRQILKDAFVGTTAERTIRSVECPVLMVNGPPVGPYRHIMLTTDFSDNARHAMQRFLALSLEPRARQSILHVFDVLALRMGLSGTLPEEDRNFHITKQDAEARREMARFTGGIGKQQMNVAVRYLETTEAAEIHKAAGELGADLIVVSTQGKGAVARMVLGSVTQQVLQAASVDVLVIPPARSS